MALRKMGADELLANHPEAHEAFLEDESEAAEDDDELDDWSDWHFFDGFDAPVPAGTVVGERFVRGPREPAIVWTGERWICSEHELDDKERELMDSVAAQCPGGLSGWN